ncbi:GNAT family N-acetyltransferase [Paenibacillus ginsengarvi]|nr:GNAT family N-acetyltransferase [Paenibacillus ginsengarvi]
MQLSSWDKQGELMMGMEACIRQALPSDVVAVSELSGLWEAEQITYGLAASDEGMLADRLGDYFYVSELDGILIGYIFGVVHVSEGLAVIDQGERYLEIEEVYVHPDHRGGRIGHRLVDELLRSSEHNGVTRSVVYSATKQWQKMVGFYEKFGFQMWFIQMYR